MTEYPFFYPQVSSLIGTELATKLWFSLIRLSIFWNRIHLKLPRFAIRKPAFKKINCTLICCISPFIPPPFPYHPFSSFSASPLPSLPPLFCTFFKIESERNPIWGGVSLAWVCSWLLHALFSYVVRIYGNFFSFLLNKNILFT